MFVLFVLGIGLLLLMSNDTAVTPAYSLGKITRGSLKAEVSATGTLSPVITVQVGSQVSGTIQHLYVDFNNNVKKGQVIAQIDPAIFKAKLAEAEANVRSSQAARELFGIANPLGETIVMKGMACRILGVLAEKGASAWGSYLVAGQYCIGIPAGGWYRHHEHHVGVSNRMHP